VSSDEDDADVVADYLANDAVDDTPTSEVMLKVRRVRIQRTRTHPACETSSSPGLI